MPRRRAPVRRGDARVAIFIILGMGLFAMVGLILAVVMLASVHRSAPAKSPPPQPVAERFGGLLSHCPPDATSVTAVDVTALNADPNGKEIIEALTSAWTRRYEPQFAKVPLTVAEVDAFVSVTSSGNPEQERGRPPQERRGFLTAIRFSRPVAEGEILRGVVAGTFKSENRAAANGERYQALFRIVQVRNREEREDDLSLRLADERTLLIATTRREMEESTRRRPGHLELSGPLHRVIERSGGTVISAAIAQAGPRDEPDARYRTSRTAAGRSIRERRAGSVWFTLNGDRVEYHEGFLMPDGPRAKALCDALLAEYAKVPPAPPAADGVAELPKADRVGLDADLVTVDASISRDRFIQQLKNEMVQPGPKSK